MKDPDEEVLANRRAAKKLMNRQAKRGCRISAAVNDLLLASMQHGSTAYLAQTGYDYRDEDEEDDIREF